MSALERFKADRPQPKPGIDEIVAYVPGKSKVEGVAHPIKLSSNENILGSSPKALSAYAGAAKTLNLYPDSQTNALRAAVAEHYRLEPERLVFGCGTDEILGRLVQQIYLEPGDNIVQGQYGFGAYGIGARACQAEVRFAPEPDLRLDVDEMLGLIDERTRLVFVTQPSNPTGTWLTRRSRWLPGPRLLRHRPDSWQAYPVGIDQTDWRDADRLNEQGRVRAWSTSSGGSGFRRWTATSVRPPWAARRVRSNTRRRSLVAATPGTGQSTPVWPRPTLRSPHDDRDGRVTRRVRRAVGRGDPP